MQTKPAQTAAQIRAQIDEVLAEIDDIHRDMPGITSTTDLLGAQAKLRDCESVVELLAVRLKDAEERERVQAEQDRRQANEDTMTEARAAYADVADQLRARRLQLVRTMTAEMDESDPLTWECQRLQNEFQTAWLANNPDKRHDSFTWAKLPNVTLDGLSDKEQHAADVIEVLHASRYGLPGNLNDLRTATAGQANAQWRAMHQAQEAQQAARPPELTRAQEVDLISSEIRAKVLSGLDDRISTAR